MSSANISRVRDCYNVLDRKSTRLNSSHDQISYAVFCLKKKKSDRKSTRLNSSHDQISYAVFRLKKKKAQLNTPTRQWSNREDVSAVAGRSRLISHRTI